jgi:hypothetical protein
MSSRADPRTLLDALRTPSSLPDFAPDLVERARALANDPGTAAPLAVESLPEPLALAVLEGTVLAGSPALAEALTTSAHKALAKAAKKALYRLRSRGIEVTESRPPPAEAPTAPRPASAPETLPAVLTRLDGLGERVLEIARPLRGGGVELIQVLFTDEHGVVRLEVAETNRGTYRRMVKQATAPGPDGAVEIPHAEAVERLAAAAGQNLRSRSAFPNGLEAVLRHLDTEPRETVLELPPPEPDDERLTREAHTLHDDPQVRGWMPPMSELERLARKVEEIETSPLALSSMQRDEELIQAARSLAHAFFTPEVRRLYAGRLWEMALHFERRGKPPLAQLARAEARRLFHGPPEPPSRFAERLFEKALLVTMAQRVADSTRAPEEAGAPAEPPPTAPSRHAERRSPGGIILP